MTTYVRPSDGLEMVPIAPWQWINRRDGERLGLVARVAAPAVSEAKVKPTRKAKPAPAEPDAVVATDEPMLRYARLLFRIGNTMREVLAVTGLSREVASECRRAAKA